jgi:DNA-directed RNA polymerase specialized sigma24 family protein
MDIVEHRRYINFENWSALKKSTPEGYRVKEEKTTVDCTGMRFHTTTWDLVLNSGDIDAPQHSRALAELCSLYWYPLYSFARYKGFSEDDAKDLTQSFFLHLLEKTGLKQAHPHRGRFRSFLLACFQNHMSTHREYASAGKRGGGHVLMSLDAQEVKELHGLEPVDDLTAQTVFDARWATILLDRVMVRISEEYRRQSKASAFELLRMHLNLKGDETSVSYERSAKQLGLSLAAVKTQVCRMRKRFAAFLRDEVAKTVFDPSDIDAEIHALYDALVATEGRLEE